MIEADKRKAVYLLHQEGMSQREISRRLAITRNTVRAIVKHKGVKPVIRREKKRIDEELLRRLYDKCDGVIQRVHEKLTKEKEIEVAYSTLTCIVRDLGLRRSQSNPTRSADAAQKWLAEIIHGARSFEMLKTELGDSRDLAVLLHYFKNGSLRERKKAAVILARKRGIPNTTTAKSLHSSRMTTREYLRVYRGGGPTALFEPRTRCAAIRNGGPKKARRILELLHGKPSLFDVNRTSWTQQTLIQVYRSQYDEVLSRHTLTRLMKNAGYAWKRAVRVLTSPDPDYREKVGRMLRTLRSLAADEVFFFLDEWGPIQVRRRGGKAYRSKKQTETVPRKQKPKGTVTLVGALSATTNQMTWLFEPSKDTHSMINLVEILHNQHHTASRLYITWDAVGWHRSTELTEWLDAFNDASRRAQAGPLIELVPLPTSAQFLNVIEGVFTAMTRAVIHNSDYQSPAEMKSAISRHFRERNAHFQENPRRAGKKIWDLEFFSEYDSLGSGNYGEW